MTSKITDALRRVVCRGHQRRTTDHPAAELTHEERKTLLVTLIRLFGLPVRREQVEGALSLNLGSDMFVAALEELGIQAQALTVDWSQTPRSGPVLITLPEGPALVLGVAERAGAVLLDTAARIELERNALPARGIQLRRKGDTSARSAEEFGWRWFVQAFFSDRRTVRTAFVASLVIQLLALAFPLATQAIVDKVIANQAENTLVVLGAGVAMLVAFSTTLSWLRQTLLIRFANLIDARLAQRVFDHLVHLPLAYFEQRSTGATITRVHGVERIREFLAGAFLLIALELPFMFVFLAMMFSYSALLSGVVGFFLVAMLSLSLLVGPRLRRLSAEQFQRGAAVQGFLTEHVGAPETLKALQLESHVGRRFAELNQEHLAAATRTRELANSYGSLMQGAEQLMNVLVLCLGAYLAMSTTTMTIGMLVAFQMFSQRVSQPLLRISGYWQELQHVRIAISQLGDVMNTSAERYAALATSVPGATGRLSAERLTFRYAPGREPLFENLSFVLEPGQILLVSGPSGSGKSTLTRVLLGLHMNYSGTVRIDGRDARSMSVNEARSYFGVVPQESILFSGTVLENLRASVPYATFEQVVSACRLAGVHETVENLPDGYQTVLGERGVGLSGGQRQRLAIARALLKRPRILVFDESTSGLDEAAAELIAQTVNQLRGRASVLFIAHKVPRALRIDARIDLGTPPTLAG